MLLQAPEECQRHLLGLEIYGLRNRCHGRRCIAVTPHLQDSREQRFVLCPLETPPHPEAGLAVPGNEQHTVLHRAGEVVQVELGKNYCNFPVRMPGVHQVPETVKTVGEFAERDF